MLNMTTYLNLQTISCKISHTRSSVDSNTSIYSCHLAKRVIPSYLIHRFLWACKFPFIVMLAFSQPLIPYCESLNHGLLMLYGSYLYFCPFKVDALTKYKFILWPVNQLIDVFREPGSFGSSSFSTTCLTILIRWARTIRSTAYVKLKY